MFSSVVSFFLNSNNKILRAYNENKFLIFIYSSVLVWYVLFHMFLIDFGKLFFKAYDLTLFFQI